MAITEITTKSIKDGEVVNADVNASAAIAGSKISPDFGSQNITTTGTLGSGDMTITGSVPALAFTESDGNPDFTLRSDGGIFRIRDVTNTSDRIQIQADGTVDIIGNLDAQAGIDVTGAIAGTTTISDGKGDVRSIPSNAQSGAYVAVAADAGKVIYISTGGVTVNTSVFSAGDAITIINNSGSNQAITQGTSMTIYNTSDGTSGSKTLGARGMATIWFAANDIGYISGGGLS